MRILVISAAVIGTEETPGEDWSALSAQQFKGNLYASSQQDLVDYDVFIVDQDKVGETDTAGNLKLIQTQIVERVAGGGCLICFASVKRLPWLPVNFDSRGDIRGKRFTIEQAEEPLSKILAKRQGEISYKTQFQQAQGWTPVARALDTYPIAGFYRHSAGLILMLPEFQNRAAAVRDILDDVIPRVLPNLREKAPVSLDEEPPEWLGEFPIAKSETRASEIAKLSAEIDLLWDKREARDRQRRELLEYQGLLWLEGKPLEAVVHKALNLLGIAVEPKHPIDLACSIPGGGELYIEVEGTTGPIQVRKGRQLLGYIAEAEDPATILGAITGNPYRREPPESRPPPKGQVGLFSPQLESLAGKQGWALLPTTQLYEWVTRHLDGDKKCAKEARKVVGLTS